MIPISSGCSEKFNSRIYIQSNEASNLASRIPFWLQDRETYTRHFTLHGRLSPYREIDDRNVSESIQAHGVPVVKLDWQCL